MKCIILIAATHAHLPAIHVFKHTHINTHDMEPRKGVYTYSKQTQIDIWE